MLQRFVFEHEFEDMLLDMNRCYYQASLCQNGGTCIPGVDGAFTCQCPASWGGAYCSQYIPVSGMPDCSINSGMLQTNFIL